ncbi:hypothetical protein C8R48DRAFT_768841 [Suillus tomentosus]|nr:hypothetical protein C8R48DRAFT_768841 [Suillus tomentosus]
MILFDAMIDTYQDFAWEHTQYLVGASLIRRDQWSSQEDALRSFKSSPMFSAWHPDILQLYVHFGLYEDDSGGVRLKMVPVHEAIVLANPRTRGDGKLLATACCNTNTYTRDVAGIVKEAGLDD